MLLNLFIKDFGIIEKTETNFSPGLNVLSGETGSGKSIIIDAIQVATGGRASTEYLRAGCERAIVQMTLETGDDGRINGLLSERGISGDEGGILVMSREINKNGRSTCRINGQMVNLSVYREIGRHIVDIQGQHDQQLLFDPGVHLNLLDAYGGEDTSLAGDEVSRLYREWYELKKTLDELRDRRREWARRQDAIHFQIAEIDGVSPKPGEDDELYAEKRKLAGAEKLSRLLGECHRDLHGGGSAVSSLELAGHALKSVEKAAEIDESLSGIRDLLAGSLYQMEECCRELSAYMDGLEFYPARLEFVEERLDLINRLKKKYGETIEEVLKYREEIEKELEDITDGDRRIESMEQELLSLFSKLTESAARLTKTRKTAAGALEREIAGELQELGMGKAKFVINFSELESTGEKGNEKAEFYISTNPGEPLRPMARIASGGETSRILLAVKSILAETENIPTLIFDEIDTGIGGLTMKAVALKLLKLAEKRQVICVTHSSTVASMADRHLSIRKSEASGRTRAEVFCLDGEERVEELARMMGGDQGGSAAINHARHLLEEARTIKCG
ncbi:MAG: DNA repair protein RecN [Bacillota bacterium]